MKQVDAQIRQLADELPADERDFVRYAYLDDGNLSVAADKLGIHKTTASRMNTTVLAKLRRQLDQKRLRPRPPEHSQLTHNTGEHRMDVMIDRNTLTLLRNKLQVRMREIDAALTLCDSGFFDWLAGAVSGNLASAKAAEAPAAQSRRPRQNSEELAEKLEAALSRIEAEFTRKDFGAVLSEVTGEPVADHQVYGYLGRLERVGKIEVVKLGARGLGNSAVYRKVSDS